MADIYIKDIEGLDEFIAKLDKITDRATANRKFQLFLEKEGFEFLDVLQDMIISMQVVDTRRLLNSFDAGGRDGVFKFTDGGLTLLVGTNVDYARYVNDGHWTNPKGVDKRFVPGIWNGDKFTYRPGAKTGMVLKQQFIEGQPYWDKGVASFEKMFGEAFERLAKQWLESIMR